ncbi:MAG: efflux RND transporter periplasmic adaptor subunit [Bacteroidales bacterium]|nr:efflux RND transporter periplasmic adaptor subunit [Bacteroidales bacterium]
MKSAVNFILITFLLGFFVSCKSKTIDTTINTDVPKVAVKTTTVIYGEIDDIVSLNGKTVFLKKDAVISSITGYVKKVNVQYGDEVHKNDLLFEIQTKENRALENSGLDQELASLKSGIVSILAPSDGIISDLNANSTGMFVAEGAQLCTIVANKEITVLVNVPYQYNKWIKINKACKIILPDSTFLDGNIVKIMPLINAVTQTQDVLIKVRDNRQVPENLNVIVQFVRSNHSNAMLIPKEALLTNEAQQAFWVMKILHDSLAINVPVKKGFENNRMVEIFSPDISVNDTLISEGAYGLPDSTIVKVVK